MTQSVNKIPKLNYDWILLGLVSGIAGLIILTANAAPSSSLTAPNLTAPANGSGTGTQPQLTWSGVQGAKKYRVQVTLGSDTTFNSPTINATTTVATYTPTTPLASNSYRWRARAEARNIGPWSTVFTFTAGTIPAPPARVEYDRPDDSTAAQLHIMYVLPSDGADRAYDTGGQINTSAQSFLNWFKGQTGTTDLRVDTYNGQMDITFRRLSRTDTEIENYGPYVRDQLEQELKTAGFNSPNKLYAVYYDGRSNYSCGGGAWPPTLPGRYAALYLRGAFGTVNCDNSPFTTNVNSPAYREFAMIHEIFHTLGAAPTCAPNQTLSGHVSGDSRDLMYSGTEHWSLPALLDIGRNDYYKHSNSGCLDVAKSVFLNPIPSGAVYPPSW